MNPHLFPAPLAHALGWTLVHSLWQACCAALVLAWALSKYSQPCMRYRVAYGGLVAVLLAAVLTFLWLYEPGIARTP
ncbi:MAG TPA: hypothetical protein PKD78_07560, partial [Saprospiraceae bacterium]|nr:hypothetical protein [Saprospiraceae bacterium]